MFVISYFGFPCANKLLDTVIMITYLHHTAPDLPHYRGKEWNFQRGAAATVDRNFLGWQGRFFLHDVAHYHVIHHVCSIMNPLPLIIAEQAHIVFPEDAILRVSPIIIYYFLLPNFISRSWA